MSKSALLCSALVAWTLGCGPQLVRAPMLAADDPGFAVEQTTQWPGVESDPPYGQTLLPGDLLHLRVASIEPVEVDRVEVDGEGVLAVPWGGAVKVAGKTLGEAREAIELHARRMDRFARVMLTMTDPAGHRATVVGVVEHPGIVSVRPEMRVVDLLVSCGGARTQIVENESVDIADMNGIKLVREGAAVPIDVVRALQGDPRHNVRVHPGDVLFVPPARGRTVSVLGQVRSAKSMPYRRGMRLTEALALAGGLTQEADLGDVRIVRGPLSSPRVYRASVSELFSGQSADVQLEPGDVVFVTEHWVATVSQVIQRLSPALAFVSLAAAFSR